MPSSSPRLQPKASFLEKMAAKYGMRPEELGALQRKAAHLEDSTTAIEAYRRANQKLRADHQRAGTLDRLDDDYETPEMVALKPAMNREARRQQVGQELRLAIASGDRARLERAMRHAAGL